MKLVDNQLHVSKAELVSALKKLVQGQLLDATEGICDNLEDTLLIQVECNPDTRAVYNGTLVYLWMRGVVTNWPKWSRDSTYPVPNPNPVANAEAEAEADHEADGFTTARDAYWQIADKWEGEYGELRLELVNFLIEELEHELR